jgi:hypothetical protein
VILRIACTIISSQIFTNRGASGSSCELLILVVSVTITPVSLWYAWIMHGVSRPVSDNSFIRAVITNICFSVSMVSLLILIVVYRKIGMTSTIPGSNLAGH